MGCVSTWKGNIFSEETELLLCVQGSSSETVAMFWRAGNFFQPEACNWNLSKKQQLLCQSALEQDTEDKWDSGVTTVFLLHLLKVQHDLVRMCRFYWARHKEFSSPAVCSKHKNNHTQVLWPDKPNEPFHVLHVSANALIVMIKRLRLKLYYFLIAMIVCCYFVPWRHP